MKKTVLYKATAILCLVPCFASCGKAPRPRTATEITADQMTLPSLYLTESGKEIIAPGGQGVVIDEDSREIGFPAFECLNPNCPKKGTGSSGRPYLFPLPEPTLYVKPDGTLGRMDITSEERDELLEKLDLLSEGACPACYASRNVDSETEQQRQQYGNWIRPYVLPETRRRQKELDEEHERRKRELDIRRKRKVS